MGPLHGPEASPTRVVCSSSAVVFSQPLPPSASGLSPAPLLAGPGSGGPTLWTILSTARGLGAGTQQMLGALSDLPSHKNSSILRAPALSNHRPLTRKREGMCAGLGFLVSKMEAWVFKSSRRPLLEKKLIFFRGKKKNHHLLDLINRKVWDRYTHRNVCFRGAVRLPAEVNLTSSSSLGAQRSFVV